MIMKMPEGVEWALHCTWLLTFAREGDAVPARRLAEFYDLPEAYLAKLLKALVRAGLLRATSGPRGGFRLARPPRRSPSPRSSRRSKARGHCSVARRSGSAGRFRSPGPPAASPAASPR